VKREESQAERQRELFDLSPRRSQNFSAPKPKGGYGDFKSRARPRSEDNSFTDLFSMTSVADCLVRNDQAFPTTRPARLHATAGFKFVDTAKLCVLVQALVTLSIGTKNSLAFHASISCF
jgi:hypothetical protein